MASFELVALVYFLAFAAAAGTSRVRWQRRTAVVAAALGMALAIVAVARTRHDLLRAWIPHVYLVAGYWLPALVTPALVEPTRFERWLVASDMRLRPLLPRLPAPVVHVTELAYLVCYPMVPATCAVLWVSGTADEVSRFWVAVLVAGYACYALLPWLVSRPPRLVGQSSVPPRHIGAVNVFVLGRVSHQLNTFPSGHVAVSLAAAAMVASVSSLAGAVAAAVAAAIAVGAAAGRYHYVVDVLAGVVVAAAAVGGAVMWG